MTHVKHTPVLFVMRPTRDIVLLLLTLIAQSGPAASSPGADFYIVEHVHALRIYDSYQQPVRTPADAGILPFTPFKIVEWESVMGDGFTPCARVEFKGKAFMLLRDPETRAIMGESKLGFTRFMQDAEEVNDTILVKSVRRLELSNPPGTRSLPLEAGERLVRYFRHQGRTYVGSEGERGVYGWISFPPTGSGGEWEVVHETMPLVPPATIDPLPRIRAGVDQANTTLQRIYAFLNAETGRKHPAPRWVIQPHNSSYVCVLRSSLPPESHAESTAQLAKRIESQLLGTGYSIRQRPGRIEVRP